MAGSFDGVVADLIFGNHGGREYQKSRLMRD